MTPGPGGGHADGGGAYVQTGAWSQALVLPPPVAGQGRRRGIVLTPLPVPQGITARTGQQVHGNQEMIGIGAANLAAGLFQGFPVSTSGSRTAVAERSGAKTQFTGVTGAVLIILMIVFLPGLFRTLPPAHPGRRGDHRIAVAGGYSGNGAALAATQGGMHAVDRGLPWRGLARRAFRNRDRGRPVDPQCVPAGVVALSGGARPRGRGWRATTTRAPTRPPATAGPGDLPAEPTGLPPRNPEPARPRPTRPRGPDHDGASVFRAAIILSG